MGARTTARHAPRAQEPRAASIGADAAIDTGEVPIMSCYLALFRGDRSGAVAIEYVLIAALIGLAIIAGATTLGQSLNTFYTNAGNALPGA